MKTKSAVRRALGGSAEGDGPATGLVGRKLVEVWRSFSRKVAAGGSSLSRSSPGSVRGTPYRSSAEETLWSSFGADQSPRSIQGRWESQSEAAKRARRESFNWRWKRSIILLA